MIPRDDPMPIGARLRADLTTAKKDGDTQLVALIKNLLAAIGNAEAIELTADHPREVVGSADVPRRALTPDEAFQIIRDEAAELRSAAEVYRRLGRADEAENLQVKARIVDRYSPKPIRDPE